MSAVRRQTRVYSKKAVPEYYFHRVSILQKRRGRRAGRHVVLAIKAACVLTLAGAVVFGLFRAGQKIVDRVKNDPAFTVRQLGVKNNWKVKTSQIGQLAGVLGKNIFDVDLKKVSESLERCVNIRRAIVTRRLPATIEVIVFEREPFAYFSGRRVYVVDVEGVVLGGPFEAPPDERLPVIVGPDGFETRVGARIDGTDMSDILQSLVRFYASGVSSKTAVTQARMLPLEGVVLELRGGQRVVLGQGDYDKKIGRLAMVYEDLARKHLVSTSIDLRFNDAIVKLSGGEQR